MFVWVNAGESCSVGQYWKPGQLTVFVTQRRGDKREKGDISKKAVLFSDKCSCFLYLNFTNKNL